MNSGMLINFFKYFANSFNKVIKLKFKRNSFSVDIFYQINCKNQTDHSYLSLAQKVHELASNYGATTRYICVFERDLQETIAKIRYFTSD